MLETGDLIDIKMQDETRYKKPIGIYWTQVFSNYIFGHAPSIKYGFIEFHHYLASFYPSYLFLNLYNIYILEVGLLSVFSGDFIFNNLRSSSS